MELHVVGLLVIRALEGLGRPNNAGDGAQDWRSALRRLLRFSDVRDQPGSLKLFRYVNRPLLASGHLQILDPEQVAFDLKTPWDDGTYRIVLSPHELIEKLAALVPPRRLNLVRYHGFLAPNAAGRAQIVPGPEEESQDREAAPGRDAEATPAQRRHRLAWATLLARVFRVDVTICPACGGHMSIVAALTEPRSIARYVEGVGLPSRAPPIAPARPQPQPELDFAA